MQDAIDKTFSEPEFGKKNEEFIKEFRHNTAVFAAFKNHRQTKEIIAALYDEQGNLRSFHEFKKRALKISKDYNVNWLRTEYNTAVRAARSAVNYRKFLEAEHLYPNLEYIESTAKKKREAHLEYVGTVLPIRHPWWETHMPPSDWNCACSVRQTDKEATPVPGEELVPPVFQNNPGKTAEFVKLDEHPYIKGVCPYFSTCLRRKGKAPFPSITFTDTPPLGEKEGAENPPIRPECKICELAKAYMQNKERIEANRKVYENLKKNRNYYNVKFNPKNGGLQATHVNHNFDPRTGEREKHVQKVRYNHGRAVIFESEKGKKIGENYTEGTWDNKPFEIASVETGSTSNVRNALKHCAKKDGSKIAVVHYLTRFELGEFHKGYKRYKGLKGTTQYKDFDMIICIYKSDIVYVIK